MPPSSPTRSQNARCQIAGREKGRIFSSLPKLLMLCSPINYYNNWSLCELDTHYILLSYALTPADFLYKRPLLSPNGHSSPNQLLVQVTGSQPPDTDPVDGAGKREGCYSMKDGSVLCHMANAHTSLKCWRKSEKGSLPAGCLWYYWQGCSHYLPLVFVSMMMFTATWKRIATKLGYDELLSWREKWIQQRNNVWDLRYCVLFEVTFRC